MTTTLPKLVKAPNGQHYKLIMGGAGKGKYRETLKHSSTLDTYEELLAYYGTLTTVED